MTDGTGTYLLAHLSNSLLNTDHIQRLGIAHDGGDEALLGGDGNADIDVVAVHNCVAAVGALDRGVDGGQVAHGEH